MMNVTPVVKQLLIINIIFFIGTMIVGTPAYNFLAMHYPETPLFQYWQPLTSMFMHFGLMHIFFNMFALYSFGSALEHFWGGKKFLFFYLSCGFGALLLDFGVNWYFFQNGLEIIAQHGTTKADALRIMAEGKIDTRWQQILSPSEFRNFIAAYAGQVAGASGAISGLLVAFAFMFPNSELMVMFISIPVKAKYFVAFWFGIDLFLGIGGKSFLGSGDGIAHFAHLGGALVGFVMMWYWKKNQFNRNRWN